MRFLLHLFLHHQFALFISSFPFLSKSFHVRVFSMLHLFWQKGNIFNTDRGTNLWRPLTQRLTFVYSVRLCFYGKMCTLQEITGKQFNNSFIHSSSKGLLLGCLSSIAKLSFTCAWNISSCCSFQSSSSSAVLYSSVSRGSVTGGGLGWAGGTRCGSERGMALDVWLLSSEEERLY